MGIMLKFRKGGWVVAFMLDERNAPESAGYSKRSSFRKEASDEALIVSLFSCQRLLGRLVLLL